MNLNQSLQPDMCLCLLCLGRKKSFIPGQESSTPAPTSYLTLLTYSRLVCAICFGPVLMTLCNFLPKLASLQYKSWAISFGIMIAMLGVSSGNLSLDLSPQKSALLSFIYSGGGKFFFLSPSLIFPILQPIRPRYEISKHAIPAIRRSIQRSLLISMYDLLIFTV